MVTRARKGLLIKYDLPLGKPVGRPFQAVASIYAAFDGLKRPSYKATAQYQCIKATVR